MRQINKAGLDIIKSCEACHLKAYRCPAGIWTIGWGSTHRVREGMSITQFEADMRLDADTDAAEESVRTEVKVDLTDNQFSALVSFCFNVGEGNFEKSTLLKKLNQGNYGAVATEMHKWIYANRKKLNGLVIRRKAEGELFNQ